MDDSPASWPEQLSRHLGQAIASARKAKGMSAVKLSEVTADIGMRVHRVAIPRIEKGEQVATVPELIALGIALEADWSLWLFEATEAADIGSTRSERIQLESARKEIQAELSSVTERIAATQFAIANPNTPQKVRRFREVDLDGYQALASSLREQLVAIESLIRINKLGRAANRDIDA